MLSLNAETCRFACKRILPQVGVGPKERGKRLCIQQGFSCCQSGVTGSGLFFTMDANNWATFRVPSFWDVFQLIYIYINRTIYIYRWLRYMHAHELICRSTCFRGFIMYMVRIPGKFAYIFKFYYNLQPWIYINSAFLKKNIFNRFANIKIKDGTTWRRAAGSSFSNSTFFFKSWSTSTCPPVLSRQTCGGVLLDSVSRTGASRFGGEQGSWGFILATIKVDKLEMIQKEAPKNIVDILIYWTYVQHIYQGSPFPCQRFPN